MVGPDGLCLLYTSKLTSRIRSEDLSNSKFKKISSKIDKLKLSIKATFFDTQNLILKSFFNKKINDISSSDEVIDVYKRQSLQCAKIAFTSVPS